MSKDLTEDIRNLPYWDQSLDLEKRVQDLLDRLSAEEKFKLLAGRHHWYTKPIERLGIKPFNMTDGPHGISPNSSNGKECTYFPTTICKAATWNRNLSKQFGKALAEEVREIGYHMILGPGINIDRTPLCGRTFEYQTEDPFLNKELAVPTVNGIQDQRIAACVKHYICNNQELNRHTYSAEVGERALKEIYYPAFKACVEEADAWSFMGCYNKINGVYGCEHEELLRDVLMENWGFRGFVVSDWRATKYCEGPETCLKAGLSLEMPRTIQYKRRYLRKAFKKGKFTEEILNDNIKRLLRVMFLVGLFDDKESLPEGSRNTKEHQIVARKIAEEGIVLLKNEGNLLPLNINEIRKLAILGPNADKKLAEGGGSSLVRPPYEITPLIGIQEKIGDKIVLTKNIEDADAVILVLGLNHEQHMDAENWDKKTLALPEEQLTMINSVVEKNKKVIVTLINGSPISMDPWIEDVPVIIEAWYPGMEGGHAIADIIFGDVNPSGKLPLTFPKKLSDSPAHRSERRYSDQEKIYYDEGIFIGYRFFDKENIEPLFPFGFGLSYTTFSFENMKVNTPEFTKDQTIEVSLDVKNIGDLAGAEVIQLYVQDIESSLERPPKELKEFKKVYLEPGGTSNIKFILDRSSFAFYNDKEKRWVVEPGEFMILLGNSSRNVHLKSKVRYKK